ncbi:MAG: TonB family protein [Campylobacterota bacterium]|nr:TonB family protein [Campylobacterota bacterium]
MKSYPKQIEEKVVSIVITPAPVQKKEVVKPKPINKKIVKKKVVKEKVIKKIEPVEAVVTKPIAQAIIEPVTPKIIKATPVKTIPAEQKPLFDADMKALFISGLYAKLEEQKHYPKMAKRRKLEGVVEVSFTLCKDGEIKDVFLHKNCSHSILDKAALKVVKSIRRYKPIPDAVSMASLNLNIPIRYSRR